MCSVDDEPSDSQRTTIYVHVGEDYEVFFILLSYALLIYCMSFVKDQRLMAIATMQVAVNATWTAIDAKVLSTFEVLRTCIFTVSLPSYCFWFGVALFEQT